MRDVRPEINVVPKSLPPTDASAGTVWFGGPVECISVCLRVLGDKLNPYEISAILDCPPTRSGCKGDAVCRANGEVMRHRRIGAWLLDLRSTPDQSVDEAILALIGKLPKDPKVWQLLSQSFEVDLICNVKVRGVNQGLVLGSEVVSAAAAMQIPLGIDIFCESDEIQAAALNSRLRNSDEQTDEREPE